MCSRHNQLQPQHPQSHWEKWYANTHTHYALHKDKQISNSLLQHIAIFNEHNSTKLEEWLSYTETATDLTSESQAKPAKAKSRGLILRKHGMKSRIYLTM